jgi:hypothetical protein
MTRPIMHTGLSALGRQCSIRAYAQTASIPLPGPGTIAIDDQ